MVWLDAKGERMIINQCYRCKTIDETDKLDQCLKCGSLMDFCDDGSGSVNPLRAEEFDGDIINEEPKKLGLANKKNSAWNSPISNVNVKGFAKGFR